jgi:hypothetical protein
VVAGRLPAKAVTIDPRRPNPKQAWELMDSLRGKRR